MTSDERTLESERLRVEAMIATPSKRNLNRPRENTGFVRPRNASTMILIDGPASDPKVLMGKRNKALKFMPGALVFPGGSVDRGDGSVPCCNELHPKTAKRLKENMRGRPTPRGVRALALAAVRETAEESGLLLGKPGDFAHPKEDWEPFRKFSVVPALNEIRLFARAITPPDLSRRFDTWFFVARKSAIAFEPEGGFYPSGELEDLQWISPHDAIQQNTREITRIMLVELMKRLEKDTDLSASYPAPYYFANRGVFQRKII